MNLLERSISVLLIEDDEVDIKNIIYCFQEYNIKNTLIIARNGEEALEKLYGRNGIELLTPKPSIILLDINMPKINGFEILRQLRRDNNFSTIPVIIITTSNSESDKSLARSFNVAGYFVKPLNCSEFYKIFKQIIDDLVN